MNMEELQQNCETARDSALLGQYDTAVIFYQSCIAQISRCLTQIASDQTERRQSWLQVSFPAFSLALL